MDEKYKVLPVNGSPKVKGCTARALDEVEKTLNGCGVATERIEVGIQERGSFTSFMSER